MNQSAYELFIGLILLAAGIAVEWLALPAWPLMWVHGAILQVAGAACLLDALIRPHSPPSRLMIAGLAIAYALMLSP